MEMFPSISTYLSSTQPHVLPSEKSVLGKSIDMKDLYSEKEIKSIISKFPSLQSSFLGRKDSYSTTYYPDKQIIVINNTSITNHTVSIDAKGQATSVGSWHKRKLKGNYSNIFNNTVERYNSKYGIDAKRGESTLSSHLASMAILGKSQLM